MEDRKAFLLRISPALWKELEGWAQEELRSVNGQVEGGFGLRVHDTRTPIATPRITRTTNPVVIFRLKLQGASNRVLSVVWVTFMLG